MSRIGKKPVAIPAGSPPTSMVRRSRSRARRARCEVVLHDDVAVKLEDGQIKVDPRTDTKRARAQWGTSRTLIANLIAGVTKGFEQRLEINGVGYRAAVQGKNLQLALGYSHDVIYPIPEGITIATPKPVGDRDHRHRPAEGRPGRRRDPRVTASRSPTRARASNTRRAIFRKEGKKK